MKRKRDMRGEGTGRRLGCKCEKGSGGGLQRPRRRRRPASRPLLCARGGGCGRDTVKRRAAESVSVSVSASVCVSTGEERKKEKRLSVALWLGQCLPHPWSSWKWSWCGCLAWPPPPPPPFPPVCARPRANMVSRAASSSSSSAAAAAARRRRSAIAHTHRYTQTHTERHTRAPSGALPGAAPAAFAYVSPYADRLRLDCVFQWVTRPPFLFLFASSLVASHSSVSVSLFLSPSLPLSFALLLSSYSSK